MRRHASTRTLRERGAAAVEMAIILPLLLLVIAGIIDFGRLALDQIQLTNAVREGARVAVVSQSPTDVEARVESAAPTAQNLQVTPTMCPASGTGGDATVHATADFDWLILGSAMNMFPGTWSLPDHLEAEAVMRCGG